MFKVGQVYRMMPVTEDFVTKYKVMEVHEESIVVKILTDNNSITSWRISDCKDDILDAEYTVRQILDKCSK